MKSMDLHWLPGKNQCEAWVVSSLLPLGLTWLPKVGWDAPRTAHAVLLPDVKAADEPEKRRQQSSAE